MQFRLEDGTVVTLDEALLDLCQLFSQYHAQMHVFLLLDDTLKASAYRQIRVEFVETLKRVVRRLSGSDQPSEEQVRQLSNPDSLLCQAFKCEVDARPVEERTNLLNCLEYVHVNVDQLLAPVIYRLSFLKDRTLLAVLDFLRLPSSRRANGMFETLPLAFQGCEPDTPLQNLVDPSLHAYVTFALQLDDEMLMDVTRASVQLGIPALTHLLACRMAQLVATVNEADIRQRFGVPDDKFIDATKEKLDSILHAQAWLGAAPFVAVQHTPPAPAQ